MSINIASWNVERQNDRHRNDTTAVANWAFYSVCEREGRVSSSNALQYVVFQLDDDIVFKLNENCTVFYLMKLFRKISSTRAIPGFYLACSIIVAIASSFIYSFVRSFVHLIPPLHLHFKLKLYVHKLIMLRCSMLYNVCAVRWFQWNLKRFG